MHRYFVAFADLTNRTCFGRGFAADDDDAAMKKANGFRLQAQERIAAHDRISKADSYTDSPLVNPGLYLKAELWDATGRDIGRLEPGEKRWQRIRGGYVSDAVGNPAIR